MLASPAVAWPTAATGLQPDPPGVPLLQHVQWGDTGGAIELLAVLQDGRIVTSRSDDVGRRLSVRQLAPAGLEFVRAAINNVGLFDKTQTRKLLKPLNCCGAGDALWFSNGVATVKVSRLLAPTDSYAASATWDRFDALVAAMEDPGAWIPDSGWLPGAWQPYRATSFCLTLSRDGPLSGGGADARAVDWSGILPFATFGKPAFDGATDQRAGVIDAARNSALVIGIGLAATVAGIPASGAYPIPFDQGGTELGLGAVRLPGEQTTFSILIQADAPGFTSCP